MWYHSLPRRNNPKERTLIRVEYWWKIRNVNVNNLKRYVKVSDKGFFIGLNMPIPENE